MVKNLANFAEDEDFTHPAAVDVAARMTSYSLAATLLGHRRITDTRSNSPSGETTFVPLVKKFLHFMKAEGSLPSSQQPATGPYYEPNESSSHLPYYLR